MLVREDYKKELEYPNRTISIRDKDKKLVKRIQEWICLNKYHTPNWDIEVDIDGSYGQITSSAIYDFQELYGIDNPSGNVDSKTWYLLTLPLQKAFTKKDFADKIEYKERVVSYMEQFVSQHPTELFQNSGAWVRSFMKGKEGSWAAWCCGTLCTAMDHAADSMGKSMSEWIDWTWSCDELLKSARNSSKATYYSPKQIKENPHLVSRGDIFLVMKSSSDATHTGIISDVDGDVMKTIEANTNDEGSREGYEMCKRFRKISSGKYGIIKLL